MKKKRHSMILNLIGKFEIGTQEELMEEAAALEELAEKMIYG